VIATTGDLAHRTRLVQQALPGEDFVNNFTFDHIGAVLVEYGRTQGLELQLGIHLGDGMAFWVNEGADVNTTTIWVHNDGRHYQAMRRNEDVVVGRVGDTRCTPLVGSLRRQRIVRNSSISRLSRARA
jgi:hypothetical protein